MFTAVRQTFVTHLTCQYVKPCRSWPFAAYWQFCWQKTAFGHTFNLLFVNLLNIINLSKIVVVFQFAKDFVNLSDIWHLFCTADVIGNVLMAWRSLQFAPILCSYNCDIFGVLRFSSLFFFQPFRFFIFSLMSTPLRNGAISGKVLCHPPGPVRPHLRDITSHFHKTNRNLGVNYDILWFRL